MLEIYKYPFTIQDEFFVEMPIGAHIVMVDAQDKVGPCIWAIVDPSRSSKRHKFYIVGTGHTIKDNLDHV